MINRLIEVALWIMRACAILTVICIMLAITEIATTDGADEAFVYSVAALLFALSIYGAVWAGSYIITAQKLGIFETLRAIFGRNLKYLWFVVTFLYLGGIVTAVGNSTSNTTIFWDRFGYGVGGAIATLLLGVVGRRYRKNRFLGHVICSSIIALFALFSLSIQTP